MKINLVVDYGLHASSLTLITQKIFLELGKLMNKQKSFTVAATMHSGAGIGDVNQHYDCISIPNMGGYNFPPNATTSSKNLFHCMIFLAKFFIFWDIIWSYITNY